MSNWIHNNCKAWLERIQADIDDLQSRHHQRNSDPGSDIDSCEPELITTENLILCFTSNHKYVTFIQHSTSDLITSSTS